MVAFGNIEDKMDGKIRYHACVKPLFVFVIFSPL